ncbi:hypothetical protein CAPTEDRAFT_143259 [Capitella teleta]|uniref:EamA domain-containing protein n=1 Tax=Capitella teleta TaxID=283909 RepID=R7UGA2_CAPTE|nr:hypothetical protein CAPTEDRAFT_143259 [Capitella teleta]|eukprot:ELU05103.1 hypothetical protein CAPTEDRAFT_143259 [Capitella teleta]
MPSACLNRVIAVLSLLLFRQVLVSILLGQSLSFLICGSAVTSGLLQEYGVYIPTAQSFLNYLLLTLVYTTWLACRSGDKNIVPVMKARGWKYLILAAVDVEANYLVVKAYHYTTVTSVQLLDCFTIPTVLLLSWLFLRARYKLIHFGGVALCLLGVGALVLADVFVGKNSSNATNVLLGDVLVLLGAALYGVSNVGQEFVVRSFDRVEFLGSIGFFGCIINGIQFALIERQEVANVDFSSYQIVLCLLGFACCIFIFYSLVPIVMSRTSAASVNLNLLSADFYALLVGLFLFHYTFHVLYFFSFVFIICGVVVYSVKPPPTSDPSPQSEVSGREEDSLITSRVLAQEYSTDENTQNPA